MLAYALMNVSCARVVGELPVAQRTAEQEAAHLRLVFAQQRVESPLVAKYRHLGDELYVIHQFRHDVRVLSFGLLYLYPMFSSLAF